MSRQIQDPVETRLLRCLVHCLANPTSSVVYIVAQWREAEYALELSLRLSHDAKPKVERKPVRRLRFPNGAVFTIQAIAGERDLDRLHGYKLNFVEYDPREGWPPDIVSDYARYRMMQ